MRVKSTAKAAEAASQVLRDGRSSLAAKEAASHALHRRMWTTPNSESGVFTKAKLTGGQFKGLREGDLMPSKTPRERA